MSLVLPRHARFEGIKGPLVCAVLDGVGCGHGDEGDAVRLAATPTLDRLTRAGRSTRLMAHGRAVGLPSNADMGNSEVGHNALGCGRVYEQGASLVDQAIASGRLWAGATWQDLVARAAAGGALHFIGLLSDGNVHSHIRHLEAMLERAATSGCKRLYVHALLDGRDVPATSALEYVDRLERVLAALRSAGVDAAIASGGGRMWITMDRYDADWAMVERGWHTHVLGDGRRFPSASAAVEGFRAEQPGIHDQNLPAFVVERGGAPLGPIVDGDAVVLFNFRGDRAIELSKAFDDDDLARFDRVRRPAALFAGMMEYDGDTHVPRRYLVEPPAIERTMGEYLAATRVSQLAISETQKYGHVTYFWNGNRSGKIDDRLETYVEIPSDRVSFDQRPWMQAAEITDRLIAELRSGRHRFARVNYANGDMVGHTGSLAATVVAVEAIDLMLARLVQTVEQLEGALVITADHGNADEMLQRAGDGHVMRDSSTGLPMVKTSHTLNPVPFIVHHPGQGDRYEVDQREGAGIASVTATCLELLGLAPPADLEPSLLRFR